MAALDHAGRALRRMRGMEPRILTSLPRRGLVDQRRDAAHRDAAVGALGGPVVGTFRYCSP